MGPSHLLIGTASALAVASAASYPLATGVVVVAAGAATAKLPDVDLKLPVHHRGITHTLLVCALLTLAVAIGLGLYRVTAPYASAAALGVLVGYGMHLAADACTPHGVPIFLPFSRRDVHLLPRLLRITTGSWAEGLVVILFTAGALLLIASTNGS